MRFGRGGRSQAEPEIVPDSDEVESDLDEAADADEAVDFDDEVDWRADGPFDYDEVDLGTEVARIDLDTLILTPWDGLNLQLQVDEQSRRVLAVTGVWADSGLEVVLFAAPATPGLADQLREETIAEAAELSGTTEVSEGPFGPQVQRVLPQPGPQGEQLFHVSRVWFVEGPKWLLRGTLLGEAALPDADASAAAPFVEFFRNLVVRRGSQPLVPGDRITMKLPEGAG
ncbi:MAG: DUF3710 domain-containing protein [Propionibacteriales bacterium]|nr:DUF3710 domain-containing protein [Propionibacteriales bacterium]